MRAEEFVNEANRSGQTRLSVQDQIRAAVKKDGGRADEYFVRFTGVDRLGFSARQVFGRTPDADDPKFDPDYIGAGKGRPALWFYPLNTYLKSRDVFASEHPYVWLVRIRPDAWLQPIRNNTRGIQTAPEGKRRVGMMRLTSSFPAAIFFEPAFNVVGRFYDYAKMHQRHGEVKGAPKTFPPKNLLNKFKGLFK